MTDSVYFDKKKQGISGHYFIPREGAYVELRGQSKYASLLDTCQQASIFFYNKDSVHLTARVNRGESKNYSLAPSGDLQKISVEGRIGSVRWTVDRADSTLFYGLAMDGRKESFLIISPCEAVPAYRCGGFRNKCCVSLTSSVLMI